MVIVDACCVDQAPKAQLAKYQIAVKYADSSISALSRHV